MAVNQWKNKFSAVNLPLLVMIAWIITSGFLLRNDQYQLFLKPQFSVLIYINLIILTLFTVSLFTLKTKLWVTDSLIKGMILLIPALFIFSTGDQTLGGFALSKRTLTSPEKKDAQPALSAVNREDPGTSNPSILELIREWDKYKGSRVTLEGVYFEPREKDETIAVVFRSLVSCCAADALPLGIVIKKEAAEEIKDNDWVRITGVVQEAVLDDSPVIFMTLERIEKLPLPSKGAVYIYQ
jgi:putative membrane protein